MENEKKDFEEYLEKQLDRVNTWLTFMETKNAALIALNVAMLAVFADFYENVPLLCTIAIMIWVISSTICLWSFYPCVANSVDNVPQNSKSINFFDCTLKRIYGKKSESAQSLNLLFWGDIATLQDEKSFINLIIKKYYPNINVEEVDDKAVDLSQEIVINSKIIQRKNILFKKALYFDFLSTLIVTVLLVVA